MRVEVIRLPSGDLRPASDESRKAFGRFEVGEVFPVDVKKERNVKHHRKFMALCQVVAGYHDNFNNTDKAMTAIKIAAGHVDWVMSPVSGELVPIPKSISFGSMDQLAFEQFYQSAVQGVLTHICPFLDERSIEAAVEEVARF